MTRVDTKRLTPVVRSNLERMGRAYDGGYVVPGDAVESATSLVSFGLNYDWTFERAFRLRNRGATIRCWDPTTTPLGAVSHGLHYVVQSVIRPSRAHLREIPKYFDYRSFFRDDAVHVQRKIGPPGTDSTTIDEVFASELGSRVFVKMDIEGGEYAIWSDLMGHAANISVLVVEFHDLDSMAERFNACMDEALRHFHVVHVHGNNYGARTDYGFPCVIELTLENKRCFAEEPAIEARAYPVPRLDQPNDPRRPDYELYL